MSPEDFHQSAATTTRADRDDGLKTLIEKATLDERWQERNEAQLALGAELAASRDKAEKAVPVFKQLLKDHMDEVQFGLQETFPIVFTDKTKNLITQEILSDLLYINIKNRNGELRDYARDNVLYALKLRPDLERHAMICIKELGAHAKSEGECKAVQRTRNSVAALAL